MMKRVAILSFFLAAMIALGSIGFAAGNPYASILVYNHGGYSVGGTIQSVTNGTPLAQMNLINLTPWDISFGASGNEDNLHGMAVAPKSTNLLAVTPFFLKGINTATGPWAYRSMQIPLVNPNNAWITNTKGSSNIPPVSQSTNIPTANSGFKFNGSTNYISVPIVFNSQSSTASTGAALSFMVTSSTNLSSTGNMNSYPSPVLSYGDGTNFYAYQTTNMQGFDGTVNEVTNLLTIQALQGGTKWVPITPQLANTQQNTGIPSPQYLSVSGLAYPNFSAVAGDGGNFDLVVILQAGDFADVSLLFLAIPNGYNPLITGTASTVKR